MKLKHAMVTIAISLLLLTVISVGLGYTSKESLEQKVCENQKFTLDQLNKLSTAAKSLVSTSITRSPSDKEAAYAYFNSMIREQDTRLRELDDEYC